MWFYLIKTGFLILEESTKSIIAIDPGQKQDFNQIIEEIEKKKEFKLSHILYTHSHRENKTISNLENVNIVSGIIF